MKDIQLTKVNGIHRFVSGPVLLPENEEATAVLNNYKAGSYLLADIKAPRNLKFHRKYFKMLRNVVFNQEIYPNTTTLLHDLKLWLGLYRLLVTPAGKPIYDPKSISFAKMDNNSFGKFYQESIDAIMRHVLPQIECPNEMNNQMNMLLDF